MRRAAKVDANHRTIVAAFRALGCTAERWSQKDAPDLVVGFRDAGREANYLVEVKTAKGKQSPGQVRWATQWRTTVHLVRSVEDVQRLVKAWKTQAEALHSSHNCVIAGCGRALPPRDRDLDVDELCAALDAVGARLRFTPAAVAPSAPPFDADDYNGRPLKPGEWLPRPHADSPTVKP